MAVGCGGRIETTTTNPPNGDATSTQGGSFGSQTAADGDHADRGGSLAAGGQSGSPYQTGSGGMTGAGGFGGSGLAIDASPGSVDSGTADSGAIQEGAKGLLVESQTIEMNMVSFEVRLTNNGKDAPPVSSLKIRYYMVADMISDASSVVFLYAAWNSGTNMPPHNQSFTPLCKATFVKLTATKPLADSYLEFGAVGGNSVLNPHDTVQYVVVVNAQGENPANDYSYNAAPVFTTNDHMMVIENGNVVAGIGP